MNDQCEFSAQYWSDYAVVLETSSQRVSKAVEEYYASHDAFKLGYKLFCLDCEPWMRRPKNATPLYYVSFAGLMISVRTLLKADADMSVKCGYLGNSL